MSRSKFVRAGFIVVAGLAGACDSKSEAPTEAPTAPSEPAPAAAETPSVPNAPEVPAHLAPAAEAPPSAPAGKLRADSPCAAICARSTELRCSRASECEAVCAASMADELCVAEMAAATACMLKEPAKNWECNEEGVASIKDGFCMEQQGQAATCLTGKLPGQ
jgi:hypothetical protein